MRTYTLYFDINEINTVDLTAFLPELSKKCNFIHSYMVINGKTIRQSTIDELLSQTKNKFDWCTIHLRAKNKPVSIDFYITITPEKRFFCFNIDRCMIESDSEAFIEAIDCISSILKPKAIYEFFEPSDFDQILKEGKPNIFDFYGKNDFHIDFSEDIRNIVKKYGCKSLG